MLTRKRLQIASSIMVPYKWRKTVKKTARTFCFFFLLWFCFKYLDQFNNNAYIFTHTSLPLFLQTHTLSPLFVATAPSYKSQINWLNLLRSRTHGPLTWRELIYCSNFTFHSLLCHLEEAWKWYRNLITFWQCFLCTYQFCYNHVSKL